jgi:hypothetical protein
MLKSGMAICFLVFALASPALAVTLSDLEGYSIEVNATRAEVFQPDSEKHNRSQLQITINHRLYISTNGNIFDYSKASSGQYANQGSHVLSFDKAVTVNRGRMKAWTIDQGSLTLLVHAMEGFVIHTISVDPSKSTCTFAETTRPEPSTGRLVVEKMNGHVSQVISFTLISSACTIKKGNIFAADQ